MANETLDQPPAAAIDATDTPELLRRTAELAAAYQATIPDRRVGLAPGVTAIACGPCSTGRCHRPGPRPGP